MQIALSSERLEELVLTQVRSNFLLAEDEAERIRAALPAALARAEKCFAATKNKYYRKNGEAWFNPYHSAQYCIFLYFLSNTLWRTRAGLLCDKIYCLNKMLNALDLFYEVEMPDIFFTDHPVGSVIGRAKFASHFSFSQGCTVGNNKGVYPEIGKNVRMFSAARILGRCRIGDNVLVSSGCCIKDEDIPSGSLVFGCSPHLTIKPRDASFFESLP